jgi:hypothetical protein
MFIYKLLFCGFVLLAQVTQFYAQAEIVTPSSAEKSLKWQPVAGKNKEFVAYLPEGHETVADGNFTTGQNRARVEKKIVLWRHINGVALIVEYYEGDAEGILESLVAREKVSAEKNEVINAFTFLQFSSPLRKYFSKKQVFRFKDRLYVMRAITISADDKIFKDFFNSVMLVNEEMVVFPNLAKDIKAVTLTDVVEQKLPPSDDTLAADSKETDRPPIILYTNRPKFPRGHSGGSDEKIKVKLLLSASGQVSSVEVIGKARKAFLDAAVEAAKKTRFIPAEKDGKPISVFQMQEFSFNRY